jgi:flavin reductase (DIM6/NTAB) family NADH-FMN oxidoreductase RutF
MLHAIKKAVRHIALRDADLPQQCTIGLSDPQTEVRVWLHGFGDPIDVTHNHVVACAAAPFTVGIGLDRNWNLETSARDLSLTFRESDGKGRLLADVGLRSSETLSSDNQSLSLFHIRSCRNYCLPRARVWAYDRYQSFVRHRDDKNPEIPLSVLEARSMTAFFICPRPVVLVSVKHGDAGNIFPMNLLGSIGDGYFAFALNSLRKAAPLVERAGRAVLSTIPFNYAELVRQLGKNHRKESVNCEDLPFETTTSKVLGFPIPEFALRVREVEIKVVRKLGSHTLFFGRLLQDECRRESLQFYMVHGIYEAWRRKAYASPTQLLPEHSSKAANFVQPGAIERR